MELLGAGVGVGAIEQSGTVCNVVVSFFGLAGWYSAWMYC